MGWFWDPFGVFLDPIWAPFGPFWVLLGALGLSSWLLLPLFTTLHAFFESFGRMVPLQVSSFSVFLQFHQVSYVAKAALQAWPKAT